MLEEVFEAVCRSLSVGINAFVLIRGLPGRGKSTAANKLREMCLRASLSVVSSAADDFMVDEEGNYFYNKANNGYCHTKCTAALVDAMLARTQVVICHNTNTMGWESAASRSNAEELGYLIYVYDIEHAWCSREELPMQLQSALVSVHGVEEEHIESMRKRAQPIIPIYTGLFTSYSNMPQNVRGLTEEMIYRASAAPCFYKISKHNKLIVHVTMEHSGRSSTNLDDSITSINSSRINSSNFEDISKLIFRSHRISVLGLYAGECGVGAIIGDESSRDIRCVLGNKAETGEGMPYYLYSRDKANIKSVCPHITLAVFQGYNSKDIGLAGRSFIDTLQSALLDATTGELSVPFDQFITIGRNRFSAYLFSESTKQSLDTIYGCNYQVSVSMSHKYQYFQWIFSSQFERDTYLTLVNRSDVSCSTFLLPEKILGAHWSIADLKVRAPRGKSDDEVYSSDEFLRFYLPRGLAFLISPHKIIIPVIKGLPKFSGMEDSIEDMITTGDKSLYFRRPLTSDCKVLVTEKANGEAAHISFYISKTDNSVCLVSGSKNVHIVTRLDHPEDINLYEGDRYFYAKDICRCFYELFQNLPEGQRSYFITFLTESSLTAIFEYEDPMHQHVVPIAKRNLKFITFISLANSFEDISLSKMKSICAVYPEEAFQVVEDVGLSRVWSFRCSVESKTELETAVLLEKEYIFEGCVIYYVDSNENVIGIEKVKSGSYICSRAIREKFLSFISVLLKCLDPFYSIQKNLDKLSNCRDRIQYISAFDSIRMSLLNTLSRRSSGELERYKSLLRSRFEEICKEQVPMQVDERDSWLQKGFYLLERNMNDFVQFFVDEFDDWSGNFRSQLLCLGNSRYVDSVGASGGAAPNHSMQRSYINDGSVGSAFNPSASLDSNSLNSPELATKLGELISSSSLELQEDFDELIELFFNVQTLRDRWPQVFQSVC